MGYAFFYAKVHGEDRELISEKVKALRSGGLLRLFRESFWALLTPVIILGGIYSGIVTPTEAAAVSVFYALLVCLFVYKSLSFKELGAILRDTVKSYAPIVVLLSLAIVFGRVLALLQAPAVLSDFILNNFAGNKYIFLIALNIILLVLGMFMDVGPAIAILAPMMLAAATALVSPVHLGVIMVINLAVGMVTPPFGVDLCMAPLINEHVMKVGIKAIPLSSRSSLRFLITFIPQMSLLFL